MATAVARGASLHWKAVAFSKCSRKKTSFLLSPSPSPPPSLSLRHLRTKCVVQSCSLSCTLRSRCSHGSCSRKSPSLKAAAASASLPAHIQSHYILSHLPPGNHTVQPTLIGPYRSYSAQQVSHLQERFGESVTYIHTYIHTYQSTDCIGQAHT